MTTQEEVTPSSFAQYLRDGANYAGTECYLTPIEQGIARSARGSTIQDLMYELARYRFDQFVDKYFCQKVVHCGHISPLVIDQLMDQCLYYKPTFMSTGAFAHIRHQLHTEYHAFVLHGNEF